MIIGLQRWWDRYLHTALLLTRGHWNRLVANCALKGCSYQRVLRARRAHTAPPADGCRSTKSRRLLNTRKSPPAWDAPSWGQPGDAVGQRGVCVSLLRFSQRSPCFSQESQMPSQPPTKGDGRARPGGKRTRSERRAKRNNGETEGMRSRAARADGGGRGARWGVTPRRLSAARLLLRGNEKEEGWARRRGETERPQGGSGLHLLTSAAAPQRRPGPAGEKREPLRRGRTLRPGRPRAALLPPVTRRRPGPPRGGGGVGMGVTPAPPPLTFLHPAAAARRRGPPPLRAPSAAARLSSAPRAGALSHTTASGSTAAPHFLAPVPPPCRCRAPAAGERWRRGEGGGGARRGVPRRYRGGRRALPRFRGKALPLGPAGRGALWKGERGSAALCRLRLAARLQPWSRSSRRRPCSSGAQYGPAGL